MQRQPLTGLLMLVATALPGSALAGEATCAVTPEDAELVVRSAYQQLVQRTHSGGSDLGITLSDFETLPRDVLDTVLWLDVVTMPSGSMIDVVRQTHSKSAEGKLLEERVEFTTRWNDRGSDYLASAEGQRLGTLTAEDVLTEVGQTDEAYRTVVAMTDFAVTATLEARSRSYRAVVLWTPAKPGQPCNAVFVDHVTQSVADAAVEQLAPITDTWLDEVPPQDSQLIDEHGAECNPAQILHLQPFLESRTTTHVLGSHSMHGSFDFACRCSFDCRNTCSGRVIGADCDDYGLTTNSCHRVGVASNGNSHTVYGTTLEPTCVAGFSCGVSNCTFCSCHVTVQVSVIAGSVSFGGGGTLDTMTRSATTTCPPCLPCTG